MALRSDASAHARTAHFQHAAVRDRIVCGAAGVSLSVYPPHDFGTAVLFSAFWIFFLGLVGQKCRNMVRCGWRARRGTYDWQAKAMPQMGRQRNTPSKRTTLTCSSHQPLSSPCLNEDSTIWGEGGRGDGKVTDWTKIKERVGGRPRRRAMGAAPKLMAHGQIMEVTNKEKKTREYFF